MSKIKEELEMDNVKDFVIDLMCFYMIFSNSRMCNQLFRYRKYAKKYDKKQYYVIYRSIE